MDGVFTPFCWRSQFLMIELAKTSRRSPCNQPTFIVERQFGWVALVASRGSLQHRLYSLLGIVTLAFSALTLMGRYVQSVWNEDELDKAVTWRKKLAYSKQHGTIFMREEWKLRGWAYPISMERIEAELSTAREKENKLRRYKKVANRFLILMSAGLFILAVLLFVFDI